MTSSNPFSRRQLLGGLAALTVGGVLASAGCSSSADSPSGSGSSGWSLPSTDPTATIKVLSILDLKTANMQPVIDAFEKAHPTITIDYQSVPFDSLNSTLDSRIANKGGDPGHLLGGPAARLGAGGPGRGGGPHAVFSSTKDTFDPTAYDAGVFQDKLWALPIANSTQLLYYNKTLLKKAGLTNPPRRPTSG